MPLGSHAAVRGNLHRPDDGVTGPVRLPLELAAFAAGVQPGTVRKWVRRGHIPEPVDGLFDMVAIADWVESGRDRHHAAIAHARYRDTRVTDLAERVLIA